MLGTSRSSTPLFWRGVSKVCHFCADELYAMAMLIPFTSGAVLTVRRWLRGRRA